MEKNIKGLVAIDLETVPNLTNESLLQLENKKISKINSNKTYKEATKQKKIEEIKNDIMEFRNGIDNKITDGIIKEFSVNPLMNRIVAIGMAYENMSEKIIINVGKCLPNEKELLEWFKNELIEASVKVFSDIVFGGHNIRSFDIPSLKIALIRNNISLNDAEYSISNRPTVFPTTKYSKTVIDTIDMFPYKLDELAFAVLGENKIEDGSKVYSMFQQKKYQQIENYVKSDSMISYKIINKLEI